MRPMPHCTQSHHSRAKESALALLTLLGGTGLATAAEATAVAGAAATGTVIFYTAAVSTIAAFFLINIAVRNIPGVYYSILFILMLALIWILEGGLVQTVPSLSPAQDRTIAMMLGLLAAAFGYFLAEHSIDPQRPVPRIRKTLTGLMALSLVLAPVPLIYRDAPIALAINLLLAGMFVAHFLSIITWRTALGGKQPVAIAAATLAVAAVIVFLALFLAGTVEEPIRVAGVRMIFAFVTLATMAVIFGALVDIRRSRDAALLAALEAAQKDAKTSAALLEMERNYTQAREAAARRTRQLSTASHDIRQPLASLRAELDVVKGDIETGGAERFERILNHLDALTTELSRSATHTGSPDSGTGEPIETVPVSVLFATLDRLFGADARSKSINLRFVDSTRQVQVPAIVLMRIASNLITNAIAHSKATKILVGTRLSGETLRLDIIDNGVGFDALSLDDAFASGVKGEDSGGDGLGLSIVREMTEAHGLPLHTQTKPDKGTRFSILLPLSR